MHRPLSRRDAIRGVVRRARFGVRPDAFRPHLATSLNNLAARLAGLGRREDALGVIQEAVIIRRELAVRRPDAYQQQLEQSLRVVAWLEAGGDLSDASRRNLGSDNGPLSGLPAAFVPWRSVH
ncbi:MAG: tetratricopeptide repeat protein [Streptosporangiaceae bacterium]